MIGRRLLTITAATAALTLGAATAASAHECFIENRSDRGDAQAAANSPSWDSFTIETILTEFLGLPAPVVACVTEQWEADGNPDTLVFNQVTTIGEGSSNPNLANGKGLEHGSVVYGPVIGGYIANCA
jgi:hypothetical protein